VHAQLEAEPVVEVVGARRLDRPDPMLIEGRNPRKLHLLLTATDSGALEVLGRDRGTVARDRLSEFSPEGTLEVAALDELVEWLARRYKRPAFPDAVMARLSHVRRRIERLLRKFTDDFAGVYVALNTWAELRDDQTYELLVLLVVHEKTWYDDQTLEIA
jgi:hypothetical protein